MGVKLKLDISWKQKYVYILPIRPIITLVAPWMACENNVSDWPEQLILLAQVQLCPSRDTLKLENRMKLLYFSLSAHS